MDRIPGQSHLGCYRYCPGGRRRPQSWRHSLCGRKRLTTCDYSSPGSGCRLGISLRIQVSQRSEEHTSELQSLMRKSYAVFCLKKKYTYYIIYNLNNTHHTYN